MVEHVLEPDGTAWKPKPGATASSQQFTEARAFMIAIHKDERWNPWVMEDRAEEYAAAEAVFRQWTRAEPDFRQKTASELDQWMKEQDAEFAAGTERRKQERLSRVRNFDEARSDARLRLLEAEAQLLHSCEERTGLVSKVLFPGMDETRRAAQVAELDTEITEREMRVASLRDIVGDAEAVVDEHGYLPAERREMSRIGFMLWREREVRRLREWVAGLEKNLAAKDLDKAERATLRRDLETDRNELSMLLEIPPQTEDDMCSECERPVSWHGYVIRSSNRPRGIGPCPAWPGWIEHMRKVRQMLIEFAARPKVPEPAPPPAPKPLAVVPSGLPIAEVLKRLAAIQAEHPDAQVRRGARNKWEIWPAPSSPS